MESSLPYMDKLYLVVPEPALSEFLRLLPGTARGLRLLMLVDLPEERGGSDIDIRWGNPNDCHFPCFQF
ncbi:hypothetical protein NQ318_009638 [Aromia moschata]|uniref:Uncharacterized protein n=1 Tax=Aromia moschata TaxID=1265417 RepID=A0AAV8Y8G4_9CUCU|nr:hypothetical protein NQ318_009638 [Aromia moschata]